MYYIEDGSNLRVLLITNDIGFSLHVALPFEQAGLKLLHFRKSTPLARILRENESDLVIIEDAPPDIDGCRICRIARLLSDTPVIMLGNGHSAEASIRALQAGADFYLPKPFSYSHLVARAKALIRRTNGEVINSQRQRGELQHE